MYYIFPLGYDKWVFCTFDILHEKNLLKNLDRETLLGFWNKFYYGSQWERGFAVDDLIGEVVSHPPRFLSLLLGVQSKSIIAFICRWWCCSCFYQLSFYWLHQARLYTKDDGIYSSQTSCSWINSHHMVNRHIKIVVCLRQHTIRRLCRLKQNKKTIQVVCIFIPISYYNHYNINKKFKYN